jgi:hypothetical protein
MGRLLRSAVLLASALAAWTLVGSAFGAAAATDGTFIVCNSAGNPPPTGTFTYTLSAPAGAGGTIVQNVAVGACSAKIFYPTGAQLLVTETVPSGGAVTGIKLSGGSESTLGQVVLSAGQASVTIGSGDAVLTYTTKASGVPRRTCVVPQVVGLTLSTARVLIKHAGCRLGAVTRVHSTRIPKGGVVSSRPTAGAHVPHGTYVRLTVSRGPRP